ncbi:MAG: DUF1552 domain-containing protein, partial [Maioricimonas sp. JB049]
VHPELWTPEGAGRDFQLSPTLEPLSSLQDQITVFTNLWNRNSNTGDGHYVKTSGFLTGTTINKTVGISINCNGTSVDQLAAQQRGRETPLPSLELGTEPVSSGVDTNVGYTRVYGSHIAWRGPTQPLAKEINPRLVYERLFRAGKGSADAAREGRPLLDLVLDDARQLRNQLGVTDRQKMDEYLESVRALEHRLERASSPELNAWEPRSALDPKARPAETIPESHAEHVRLMLDMIVLAFQTDSTRICTFMFGNSVSNKNFSFLDGVKGAHHWLSHHQNDEDKLQQYQLINRWHVEQYAYLLQRLSEIPEGNGTLLDNSMVLFGSGLRDGNRHDPRNLPVVLGGRGGGRLQAGQHLVCEKETPMSNLFVSMLDAFGAPVDQFADSTGPLPGVLANA